MPFFLILLSILMLGASIPTFGTPLIITDSPSGRSSLSEHLDWYIDTDRGVDIHGAVERQANNSFQTEDHNGVLNFGFTQAAIWFYANIENHSENTQWVLEIASSKLNNVEAFIVNQGQIQRFKAGDAIPFKERSIDHPNINFAINIEKKSGIEIYLRATTDAAIDMPVTLWKREAFISNTQIEKGLYGLYYGALLAMFFYNLLLAISLRDKNYAWYVIYIAAFGLTQLSVNGLAYQYLWPDSPWWNARAFHFLGCITPLIMIAFTRHFLQVRQYSILFDNLLIGALIFFTLNSLGTLTVNSPALIFAMTAGNLLLGIFIIIVGIDVWRKGYEPAKAFVIAWVFLVAGIIIYIIRTLGIIPSIPITEFAMQIGSAAEFILLAIALSIRINFFKQQAAQTQHRINKTLKSEVERRTEDLEKITEQAVKAKKEAQYARKQAEKSADAQGEFLATMSHEIRTPLNGVLGITQLLSQTPLSDEQREFVDTINYSGESLLHVINDILDFSKITAGQLDLEHIDFDLVQLIEKTTAIFSTKSRETQIPISYNIEEGITSQFNGDPSRMIQILNNYLSNAFKFTKEGSIQVSVSVLDKTDAATKLKVSVIDSGIGIKPEFIEKLFKSFSQADTSISRKYGGTGLGLSICKKLSELMGGEVGVESQYGQGSTFWFTCVLGKAQAGASTTQTEPTNLNGKQIVIIGDNKETRLTLCQIITQAGGSVTPCNAEQAIENTNLAPTPVSLIIIDSDQAQPQDIEQIKYTLSSGNFQSSPILQILPAEHDESTLTSNTLIRPITRQKLLTTINNIFKQPQPTKEHPDAQEVKVSQQKKEKYPLNILVAEDNKVNQMVIGKLLEKNGAKVDLAENGRIAVEKWNSSNQYDLIFMDCEMPEMDGHEATRRIREIELIERKRPIKIVALSAHAVEEYKTKAKQAGMDDYITKPINQTQIIKLLKEISLNKQDQL